MLLKYNSSSETVLYAYFYSTCIVIICFWVTFTNELKIDIFSYAMAYSLQVRNQWFIPLFIYSVIIHCRTQSDLCVVVDKTSKVWFTAVRKCPQVKDTDRIGVPGMRVLPVQRNRDGRGRGASLLEIRRRDLEEKEGGERRKEQRRTSVSSPKDKSSRKSPKAVSNHDQCANTHEKEIRIKK